MRARGANDAIRALLDLAPPIAGSGHAPGDDGYSLREHDAARSAPRAQGDCDPDVEVLFVAQ
jgi:hypothetical protein